jgi:hypothetical protein
VLFLLFEAVCLNCFDLAADQKAFGSCQCPLIIFFSTGEGRSGVWRSRFIEALRISCAVATDDISADGSNFGGLSGWICTERKPKPSFPKVAGCCRFFGMSERAEKRKRADWERTLIFVFGIGVVFLLLYLAVAYREPSAFQYAVFRTVLALAAAGVAALVPGVLHLELPWAGAGFALKAGGALAVFVIVYFFSPAALVVSSPSEPTHVETYRMCLGEYERNCQPHDVYMYCYSDVGAWADARCTKKSVIPLNSTPGNKCGYTLIQVICTGPH